MHRSKPFSTVLFCSFLTITALTTVPQLTGQNKAVAQENKINPTVPNGVEKIEKKCTDKDVLALYKTVNELNIRVSVGINYLDFSRYYTDLRILQNSVTSVENCRNVSKALNKIIDGYEIVKNIWRFRIQGGTFVPANHEIVTQLGVSNSLKQYSIGDINYIGAENLETLYMQENLKDFEKLKNLI